MTTDTPCRWLVMLAQLDGKPVPELPPVQGRVHRAPEPDRDAAVPVSLTIEMATRRVWAELAEDGR